MVDSRTDDELFEQSLRLEPRERSVASASPLHCFLPLTYLLPTTARTKRSQGCFKRVVSYEPPNAISLSSPLYIALSPI